MRRSVTVSLQEKKQQPRQKKRIREKETKKDVFELFHQEIKIVQKYQIIIFERIKKQLHF